MKPDSCGGCGNLYNGGCLKYPENKPKNCESWVRRVTPGHASYWTFRALYPPKKIDARDLEIPKLTKPEPENQ